MILKETDHWLVLSKPSGLHSVRAGKSKAASVEDWLRINRPEQKKLPECGLVHRLDELTSGCLLAAKDLSTFETLKSKMQSNGIEKTYLAWVEGRCSAGKFSLYFSSRYKGSKKVTVSSRGQMKELGQCEWTNLEYRGGFSLLQISLLGGGKRHQIRAGLASLGHPIRGDRLYDGPEWNEGFGLHAFSLKWGDHQVHCEPPAVWGKRKFDSLEVPV